MPENSEEFDIFQIGAAHCAARSTGSGVSDTDSDLAMIIEAWPDLNEEVQAEILRIVLEKRLR